MFFSRGVFIANFQCIKLKIKQINLVLLFMTLKRLLMGELLKNLLNGVPNVPTCPTCKRALRAQAPYVPYVSYVLARPWCSTCPCDQVYFTDWKIKNIGFNEIK